MLVEMKFIHIYDIYEICYDVKDVLKRHDDVEAIKLVDSYSRYISNIDRSTHFKFNSYLKEVRVSILKIYNETYKTKLSPDTIDRDVLSKAIEIIHLGLETLLVNDNVSDHVKQTLRINKKGFLEVSITIKEDTEGTFVIDITELKDMLLYYYKDQVCLLDSVKRTINVLLKMALEEDIIGSPLEDLVSILSHMLGEVGDRRTYRVMMEDISNMGLFNNFLPVVKFVSTHNFGEAIYRMVDNLLHLTLTDVKPK